jgi:hypothetical protein
VSVQEYKPVGNRELLSHLRRTLSPYLYLNEVDEDKGVANLGIEIQEAILDHGRGSESAIRFIGLDNVASIKWKRTSRGIDVAGLNRNEFVKRVRERYVTIVERSHRALLPSLYKKLVRISEVNVALTPLKKILLWIDQNGSMAPRDFGRREGFLTKTNNYFGVLADLDFIKQEGRKYVAGRAMKSLQTDRMMRGEAVYEAILGEVLQKRKKYLTEVLHWTMIVPYLHWSNAYYFPAAMAGHLVKTEKDELINNYTRFYEGRHPLDVNTVQLDRIVTVDILSRQGGYYNGEEEILEQYLDSAERDTLLEGVVQRPSVPN